jgi:hypothetical protein
LGHVHLSEILLADLQAAQLARRAGGSSVRSMAGSQANGVLAAP